MSAAIMAPSPAPHDRPSFSSSSANNSTKNTNTTNSSSTNSPPQAHEIPPSSSAAPTTHSPAASRSTFPPSSSSSHINHSRHPVNSHAHAQHHPQPPPPPPPHRGSRSPRNHQNGGKSSPSSASRVPTIVVKKEPQSPNMPPRHRPRKLDLSKTGSAGAAAGRPLTALGVQEVGIACLSPGLVTQDPTMKEQLQRSMTVREQQRAIIEARLLQQSAKGDGSHPHSVSTAKDGSFNAKTPGMSRRNKAPPGLSIVAPAHEAFQNERVIQSAPLGQTFTGLAHGHPLTRHITNQPATKLSNTSHIHHVPSANQNANRLPPISDVFGHPDSREPRDRDHPAPPPPPSVHHAHHQQTLYPASTSHRSGPPLPSPGHAPIMTHGQPTGRAREFKSAEEAQVELAGGRPELLPKLVHYGNHQPPTPPSPQPGHTHHHGHHGGYHGQALGSAQKRRRAEYEEGQSPPLGHGPAPQRVGPFGYGRDSPETQRVKKDEFLSLCSRAWDLFHS